MAMFKMDQMYAGSPQLCAIAGSVVVTASGAQPNNTIISQAVLVPPVGGSGAQLGPTAALAPTSPKVTAVVNPTPAYKPQVATNCSAQTLMLDLSGFPGNITSITLNTKAAPNGTPGQINIAATSGIVFDIDNVNKFVYCGLYSFGSTTTLNWQSGMTLYYNIVVSDSFTA